MTTKHTPGPWVAIDGKDGWSVFEAEHGGNEVVTLAYLRVAGKADPRQEAFARLIAAAPELLGALHELLREHPDCYCRGRVCGACRARAAIAKATGGGQ